MSARTIPTIAKWASIVALGSLAPACAEPPPPNNLPPKLAPTATNPPVFVPAAPVDPPPVVDGDITVAYENGIRILVKRNPGAELAAIDLYVRGGARNWTKADAGVELLALRTAVSGGTKTMDRDTFTKKLSALGSTLGASSTADFAVLEAKSLTGEIDTTFAMLADAFLNPAMPATEIEVGRQRQLAGIRRDEETPDGRLGLLVTKAVWAGHPYENRAIGTVESVSALNAEALRAHLAKLRETSRLEIVVVGDVDAGHVRELVRRAFGLLPRGQYVEAPLPTPKFDRPHVEVTKADLPTNYIQGTFLGPSWRDADLPAGIVGMTILSNRVWDEVRTKRNLSYAPKAGFGWSSEVTRGVLYVTAVDPDKTFGVMLDEAKKLADKPVSDKDLASAKAQFLTNHVMQNEASDGQASWLGLTDLVGGDYRLSRTLPERIKAVTVSDVETFAQKRIKNLQTVVLGDPAKVDEKLFQSL